MSSQVGDKLGGAGLVMATDLGDDGVWGGIERTFGAVVDELCYANREFRNLSILGGGKMEWDSTAGTLTFDANIVIRDHITSNTVTITTASSPVTLTANQVGYVAKNMKPASNQTITSITVVSAGSLPNDATDGNMGLLVLFHRTSDGTCLIPWAGRELLDGDHWQFGVALSWYERKASARKPRYNSTTDQSQVDVPASAKAPAVVLINGKLYANTSGANMDLDTAGRSGLDTGAKAANTPYYLYAIPPTSGRTFDIVASVTAPSGAGPSGFADHSYIGALATESSSTDIEAFQAANGTYMSDEEIEVETHTGTTSLTTKTFAGMPTTVLQAWIRLEEDASSSGHTGRAQGANNGGIPDVAVVTSVSAGTGDDVRTHGFIPIITAQTIYIQTTDGGNLVSCFLFGWIEDPMEFA